MFWRGHNHITFNFRIVYRYGVGGGDVHDWFMIVYCFGVIKCLFYRMFCPHTHTHTNTPNDKQSFAPPSPTSMNSSPVVSLQTDLTNRNLKNKSTLSGVPLRTVTKGQQRRTLLITFSTIVTQDHYPLSPHTYI